MLDVLFFSLGEILAFEGTFALNCRNRLAETVFRFGRGVVVVGFLFDLFEV